jgi:hypothetical protein
MPTEATATAALCHRRKDRFRKRERLLETEAAFFYALKAQKKFTGAARTLSRFSLGYSLSGLQLFQSA